MLHTVHGGANARPLTTRSNAYGIPLSLRIAPELYLKRLPAARECDRDRRRAAPRGHPDRDLARARPRTAAHPRPGRWGHREPGSSRRCGTAATGDRTAQLEPAGLTRRASGSTGPVGRRTGDDCRTRCLVPWLSCPPLTPDGNLSANETVSPPSMKAGHVAECVAHKFFNSGELGRPTPAVRADDVAGAVATATSLAPASHRKASAHGRHHKFGESARTLPRKSNLY